MRSARLTAEHIQRKVYSDAEPSSRIQDVHHQTARNDGFDGCSCAEVERPRKSRWGVLLVVCCASMLVYMSPCQVFVPQTHLDNERRLQCYLVMTSEVYKHCSLIVTDARRCPGWNESIASVLRSFRVCRISSTSNSLKLSFYSCFNTWQ